MDRGPCNSLCIIYVEAVCVGAPHRKSGRAWRTWNLNEEHLEFAAMGDTSVAKEQPHTAEEGLRLVPLQMDHLSGVMSWVNDPQVMQYFAGRQTEISEEEERGYLQTLLASTTDKVYSIFHGSTYLGQCSINKIYWPARNGRIFLVLARAHQGKGYGRLALQLLIQKAWDELNLHKLWLIVRRDNRKSQALYLRQGFDFEGVLVDEYFVQDRFYDMVRMGIVRPPDHPG